MIPHAPFDPLASKGNAEALSGLARAFFYAKARALLVSHWYVPSDAAKKLTIGAFAAEGQSGSRPGGSAAARHAGTDHQRRGP